MMRSLLKTLFYAVLYCPLVLSAYADDKQPNILVIIADDMGYSDLGITGSEISTPSIDRLAQYGVVFDNFHVADTCSPTRSMLLTGVDNHRNGLGSMREFLSAEQKGKPGYEGVLNQRVRTIAEILGNKGYLTYTTGKWHLGHEPENNPHARGFSRSFTSLQGSGDNWSDNGASPLSPILDFTENGVSIERPKGFSSHLYVDRLISQIDADAEKNQPFYAYLSFQAVHWPHHAPAETIKPYAKVYAAGWDKLRADRVERMQSLGIINNGLRYRERDPEVPAWDSLSAEKQQWEAMRMAAYSGMLEDMDTQIGRLLKDLKRRGKLENTLVVFLSDNGPDWSEPNHTPAARAWYDERYPDRSMAAMGGPGTFPTRGPQWAQLSAAHFKGYKGSSPEGGVHVPLIVSWPKKIQGGRRSEVFSFVTDIVPTLLAAAEIDHPAIAGRNELYKPDGSNMLPLLLQEQDNIRPDGQAVAYELMKDAAIYQDDFKLVRVGAPFGDNQWMLFNLKKDPSELNDVSRENPARFESMKLMFGQYKKDYGVIPTPQNFSVYRALLGQDPLGTD